jgi:hypothetical protein
LGEQHALRSLETGEGLLVKNVTGLILVVWCLAVLTYPTIQLADAAEFFCPSGDVTCLIAAINEANGMPGEHVINLEPGRYTLQTVDNPGASGGNGLPVIMRSIRIQGSDDDLPSIIERDFDAPPFRIFQVSVTGQLALAGVTIQGGVTGGGGAAILNGGVITLQDSIVTDSQTQFNGAILNQGTLRVIRSIIADNFGGHVGGGINNVGDALVENSTIARNSSADGGGIFNFGSLIVKNSAINSNRTDVAQPGGGIHNAGGTVEIVNSTVANNLAGLFGGGGGIFNGFGFDGLPGRISIINSTIRDNRTGPIFSSSQRGAAGIANDGGTVQIQNTVVAGNTQGPFAATGPECSGTITSLGNNLVGDLSGCDINLQPSDLTGDPGLGSLVEFGEDDSPGKAFYPVLAGSVLINRANPAACPEKDQLGNPRVGTCDIGAVEFQRRMLVSIDIRPKSDANKINPNSSKNVNVAVFSAKGFDATTLDLNTVRFGAKGTEAAPVHVGRRDVDRDGRHDLVVRFQIQESGIQCGDTSATLIGQTSSGLAIVGSSPIRTTGCKEPKENVASRGH